MATFVLVPGAFFGGWLWQRLTPLLWAAGHTAYPLTLTGLGDRSHLASPAVDLETHVTDLVNLLHYEDLHEAILVGHSFGGMVITGAADRVPERVRRLVYLDALAPVDRESLVDLRPGILWPADETGRTPVPFPVEETRDNLPDLTEEDAVWLHARMTPHPAQTGVQPVRFRSTAALAIPRTYILCTRNGAWDESLPHDILRARSEPGWDYRELAADHVPMVARPRELADLLSLI